MNRENAIMNRKNAIMNQLSSEIFILRPASFLIKLFCKKLPPSLVKCVFLLQCYTRQVKISNVHLNFFCLHFRWGEKLDIKILFYCLQFPRLQILLFVGWNSTRVRKSESKRKFLFAVCCCSVNESKSGDDDTAATIFKKDVFRNRRAPSPTSSRFSP